MDGGRSTGGRYSSRDGGESLGALTWPVDGRLRADAGAIEEAKEAVTEGGAGDRSFISELSSRTSSSSSSEKSISRGGCGSRGSGGWGDARLEGAAGRVEEPGGREGASAAHALAAARSLGAVGEQQGEAEWAVEFRAAAAEGAEVCALGGDIKTSMHKRLPPLNLVKMNAESSAGV